MRLVRRNKTKHDKWSQRVTVSEVRFTPQAVVLSDDGRICFEDEKNGAFYWLILNSEEEFKEFLSVVHRAYNRFESEPENVR